MKRTAPVYLLAVIVILCAVGLALVATSPEIAAKPAAQTTLITLATPVPAATFHYSTVGSCGCEVKATGTITPTLTPGSE